MPKTITDWVLVLAGIGLIFWMLAAFAGVYAFGV